MMLIKLVPTFHRCAFCKHWYDPTNAHIYPHDAKHDMWKFDENARCKCLLTNLEQPGGQNCGRFISKIN